MMPVTGTVNRRTQYEGFRSVLKAVGTGERGRRSLSFEEAREAMAALLAGEVSGAQTGAFLLAMRIKGELPGELAGIVAALRDAAPELSAPPGEPLVACAGAFDGVVDAPALSLASAVLAAACGARVIVACGATLGPKYGVTPADVLAELGGPASPSPWESEKMLARAGVTVVHAGAALPGWTELAALRDEVGLRGPVHSAEKLIDWFDAKRFVVGYTHQPYAERLVGALDVLGAERAVAVRGVEGSDVLKPARPVASSADGSLDLPEHLGEKLPSLYGAGASAALTVGVLSGEADRTVEHAVVLSAGLRLWTAGLASSVLGGSAAARSALGDGRARARLDALLG